VEELIDEDEDVILNEKEEVIGEPDGSAVSKFEERSRWSEKKAMIIEEKGRQIWLHKKPHAENVEDWFDLKSRSDL